MAPAGEIHKYIKVTMKGQNRLLHEFAHVHYLREDYVAWDSCGFCGRRTRRRGSAFQTGSASTRGSSPRFGTSRLLNGSSGKADLLHY